MLKFLFISFFLIDRPAILMINVHALTHRYPNAPHLALDDVNLEIKDGACIGLLGPNGAGKTTLISLLSGLLPLQTGTITLNNCALNKLSKKTAQRISVIPQDFAFYPRLTVLENMRFFAALYRVNRPAFLEAILASVGLNTYAAIRAQNLSGGLKRRLNFAIGLINSPKLIFMDEPTVGVDPESRQFILNNVLDLTAKGTTVIYTSHYLHEIEVICQEVMILDQGHIRYQGAIQNILHNNSAAKILVVTDNFLTEDDKNYFQAQYTVDQKGLVIDADQHSITAIVDYFAAKNYPLLSLNYGHGTLEAFYLNLLKERRSSL